MQLSNSVCIVDFFPEAFIAESDDIKGMKVTVRRFNKRVTFIDNGAKSYSTVTALTARNEWAERIAGGATVTDYHTDKMPRSEYAPMACVGWFPLTNCKPLSNIMLKGQVLKVVGQTSRGIDANLSRLEKFEVFCQVCDGLLKDGRISSAKHQAWTNVF